MKNIQSLKKILIFLGVAITTLGVFHYLSFVDIKNKIVHASLLKNTLDSEVKKQNYIAVIERSVGDASPDINSIDNSIVARDGDVHFIESLETLARKENLAVSIDSLVLEDSPQLTAQNITVLKIKAKIKGGWKGTYNFLSELESLPFKIKIDRYALVSTEDTQGVDMKKNKANKVWQGGFEIRVLKYK